jgi:hypothetical protein
VKEVSRKLFSSEQASDGREAHRGSVTVTNSRADCALTQQMIGCIKAISPCVKSASAELFPDLHTVSAPSGEERTLGEAAQVERTGWCCRRFDSGTHAWCVAMPLICHAYMSCDGLGAISLRAARATRLCGDRRARLAPAILWAVPLPYPEP